MRVRVGARVCKDKGKGKEKGDDNNNNVVVVIIVMLLDR